jgi:hypothetical protein
MACHELITAQLDILAARLPSQAVEELADGLEEAYERRLEEYGDSEMAAREAIAEFGDAETIMTAFFRYSPWRRTALVLLTTGPIMGAAWGTTLLTADAWAWPVPLPARILYGVALATIVTVLIVVIREKHAYRRTRPATIAGALGLIALDGLALIAIATMAPVPTWPMAIAVPASLIRILATVRGLPQRHVAVRERRRGGGRIDRA